MHNEPATDTLIDEQLARHVADRFKMLADPTRVRVLFALAEREMCVSEITQALGMEQSTISHQLRTLRAWKLVNYRKAGRQVYYRLNDRHIQ
ncbi:MAG: ArsR/SmtB family transcription factor, partial [Anaerolineales bacterium]